MIKKHISTIAEIPMRLSQIIEFSEIGYLSETGVTEFKLTALALPERHAALLMLG